MKLCLLFRLRISLREEKQSANERATVQRLDKSLVKSGQEFKQDFCLYLCLTQNNVGVVQVLPMFLVFVLVGHKTQCGGWSKLWRVGDSRPPVPFIFGWPADPMVMDKLCAIIHQHLVNCRATSQYLYSDQIVLQHQWKPGSVSNIGPVAAASLVRSFSSAFS